MDSNAATSLTVTLQVADEEELETLGNQASGIIKHINVTY